MICTQKGFSLRPFCCKSFLLAALVNDSQHSFGVSHLAYLIVWVSGHLPPFAKWTAFPSSDYYGGSVALGLAPGRRSHIPRVSQTFERDVGAPVRLLELGRSRPPTGRRVQATTTLSPHPRGLAGSRCGEGCTLA